MHTQEMLSLFLNKRSYHKMVILKEMRDGKIKINKLESKLGLSKRNTNELISSLIKDTNDFFHCKSLEIQLLSNNNHLYFMPQIEDRQFVELVNYLKKISLSDSSLYQALLYVLERRRFNLTEISRHLMYSESHSYKILNQVKDFFCLKMEKIIFSKSKHHVFIVEGDETSIRTLHYHLLVLDYENCSWPFTTIDKQEIDSITKYINNHFVSELSPLNKRKMDYLVSIFSNGLVRGNRIDTIEKNMLELGKAIIENRTIRFYLNYINQSYFKDMPTFLMEYVQFSFVINYFIPELKMEKEEESLGKKINLITENSIVKCSKKLLELLQNKYTLSEKNYNILLYIICNRVCVLHYLEIFRYLDCSIIDSKKNDEKEISYLIDAAFNCFSDSQSYLVLKKSILEIILVYVNQRTDVAQKIYVEFLETSEYKAIIENKLNFTFKKNALKVVHSYYEADIIISDQPPIDNEKKFYFLNVHDQKHWEKLGMFLGSSGI